MGRRPKPTALKKLAGNPGRRPINTAEPVLPDIQPDPPSFLDDIAKDEWRRLYPMLHGAGVLTAGDLAVFAAYCQSYSTWVDASMKWRAGGAIVKSTSNNGTYYQNPFLSVANRALVLMLDAASRLGLDPASRSKIIARGKAVIEGDPYDIIDAM